MVIKLAVVGGSIGLFLALGALFPRVQPSVDWRATTVNVVSGALLFAFRTLLLLGADLAVEAVGGGWISLVDTSPWIQGIAGFLVLDITRYWVHRLDHRVPWLWQFHAVHHSSEHLNSTSGLRMHWVDIIQLTAIPWVLFGLVFQLSEAVLLPVLMMGAVMDAFQHANLRLNFQNPVLRAWNLLFNNPHFHSWHHTRDGSKKDGNYGQFLTIWDRLFGSDVTEPLPPALYGLEEPLELGVVSLQLLRKRT
jgi:sterol desaturase/sphingolipid hydroxylase (fatty acid hydroxylase superfamily)